MPTFDSILVTGNQTINQDLQVNGNETIGMDLQVNGDQTVAGSLQINDSSSITNHLGVGGVIEAGDSVKATTQLMAMNQPTLPAALPLVKQLLYYNPGVLNQPGLVLTGTSGNKYVLFIDESGGTPNLAIQRV
ncbi:hypothetical protein P4H27_03165 [Paenibacillus taichungensis]|uniref:hypothetical protein n=1 Tax=Paenibacillus TaxID=44249 RepID=UPI00096DE37F|nr:hypothetical protein [Paenibacillus taichungensis]MDR9745602.1 hypothetical protein [Paenibacillus taichungensis]MEC0105925.1 hypothetical protein [Paenibacillus taichungensis]MEC0196614.1 hypothetical protein [Paenibacillus taichungensis]OME83260.1 hypothetical protein BK122_07300 [Paenibacillus pabuli]